MPASECLCLEHVSVLETEGGGGNWQNAMRQTANTEYIIRSGVGKNAARAAHSMYARAEGMIKSGPHYVRCTPGWGQMKTQ